MTIDFEQPDDVEETEEGGNRLFIILAVGMAGLIVLGLVAIGGVLILRNIRNAQSVAETVPPTPTLAIVEQLPTPTFPPTSVPVEPTNTSEPTPTATPVVMATNTPTEAQAAQATSIAQTATAMAPTSTPVPVGTPVGDGGGNGEVPDTGFGGLELVLIAAGLMAVVFVSRRMRQTA